MQDAGSKADVLTGIHTGDTSTIPNRRADTAPICTGVDVGSGQSGRDAHAGNSSNGQLQAYPNEPKNLPAHTGAKIGGSSHTSGTGPGGDGESSTDAEPGLSHRRGLRRTGWTPSSPTVSSNEMLAALIEEMAEIPRLGPVRAWCNTFRHPFAEVYHAVLVRLEELPAERQRFPLLNAAKASLLLGLFEQAHVQRRGSFTEWNKWPWRTHANCLTRSGLLRRSYVSLQASISGPIHRS
uniref:Transposase n=1 Tax=Peronospora matthiolae TaxID=2874970 RepID=A0AAV1U581_9STRA